MPTITRSDGTIIEVTEEAIRPASDATLWREVLPPVTRMQFAIALAGAGVISGAEAKAFAGGNALPALASAAIAASGLSDGEKLAAEIRALASPTIQRTNPLVLMLQAAVPLDDPAADALFAAAAQIK